MAEGMPVVIWTDLPVKLADGTIVPLRAPRYGLPGPTFGPLAPDTVLAPRIAPQRIGLGLPEAIPAAGILAREDRGDRDGISGRANQNGDQLGRFGLKAGAARLARTGGAGVLLRHVFAK